ncbi:MAG: hypothetical protein AB7E52_05335, partial [Bdellovibrionales bacterium]
KALETGESKRRKERKTNWRSIGRPPDKLTRAFSEKVVARSIAGKGSNSLLPSRFTRLGCRLRTPT